MWMGRILKAGLDFPSLSTSLVDSSLFLYLYSFLKCLLKWSTSFTEHPLFCCLCVRPWFLWLLYHLAGEAPHQLPGECHKPCRLCCKSRDSWVTRLGRSWQAPGKAGLSEKNPYCNCRLPTWKPRLQNLRSVILQKGYRALSLEKGKSAVCSVRMAITALLYPPILGFLSAG